MNWDLTPAERELLERDCRESKVPVAVADQKAIDRVVGLIKKGGKR